jgi:N-acetylglucosamine-6-phosphate deacetylase
MPTSSRICPAQREAPASAGTDLILGLRAVHRFANMSLDDSVHVSTQREAAILGMVQPEVD